MATEKVKLLSSLFSDSDEREKKKKVITYCWKDNLGKFYRTSLLIAVFISIFTFCIPANAMQDQPIFDHITSYDGLSHDTVYSIAQDKDGYLWFGTEDGLNQYNGYEIQVYRGGDKENSIGNANCAFLYVDNSNAIWIASWGGGIEVLDQENGVVRSYMNDPSNPDSISDNNVHYIFQDSKDTLWFGTYTKGLNRFDSNSDKFKVYTHNDNDQKSIIDNRVWWISEDVDGALLIATNKGLDKFNPETETFIHFSQIEYRVRTIYWDKNHTLWLGTQNGLCRFDTGTGEYKYYLHNNGDPVAEIVTSIFEDSNNNFWVGSSKGVNLFDRETGLFKTYTHDSNDNDSLSNDDVRVIFEDKSANLWIGTRGGGVNKVDIKPSKFQHYENDQNDRITLSDINIFSVFQSSDEIIWVGTNNGGLNKFDLKNNTKEYLLTDITKEENRNISAICEDVNSMWVGSLGGLNRIDKLTGNVFTYKNDSSNSETLSHNTVLSLVKDSTNTFWIGTLAGLNRYGATEGQFIRYLYDKENPSSISSDTINCLYEDTTHGLWVGTSKGLNLFDRERETFTRYIYDKENNQGISDNIIHCIYEDSANDIWIGTQYGLNQFDRESNMFTSYTTEDGLPNNCIRGIVEDSAGTLWISTNKGISCFDRNENKFTNYDVLDGLQGNGYNNNSCTITRNGEILFGGPTGLDFINSENISKNTFSPQIVITSFRVMDKEFDYKTLVKETGRISLPYDENKISVEFSSLDFTITERNQYAYMLEGFDNDWINLGNVNVLNYTNMPSGNYMLKIKGTNSDGIWNEEGLSLNIYVSPPWWASLIAYIFYFFLAILLIYLIIKYTTRRQKQRNESLEEMFKKTIQVMSKIGEIRDPYTAGHQRKVQQLSCAIASEMGLSQDMINNIYYGSLIHDIGKINISSDFLNKPGKLKDVEFMILQTHVAHGNDIIKEIGFPEQILAIVCQHHERLDGKGYPEGISGAQIGIESRIVAVADVVEAMSSDRPYRPALGIDVALEEIIKYRGVKYDENVVDACIKLFKEKDFQFTSQ